MSKYIELKIKKVYVVIFSMLFVVVCGIGGYYVWCSYHPDINIQIGDGATGKENIKMEVPGITIGGHGIAQPAAAVELKVQSLMSQHEFFCNYIKDTYQASDIKLEIVIKDDQTILKYTGTATTTEDKVVNIKKEFALDFVLDANII